MYVKHGSFDALAVVGSGYKCQVRESAECDEGVEHSAVSCMRVAIHPS